MNAIPLSFRELAADRAVHAVGLATGTVAAVVLVVVAALWGGVVTVAAVVAYAVGLLAMLSFSAAYSLSGEGRRELLLRLDHAAILVMIAGTYTPFTILGLSGVWSLAMTVLVWAIAAAGVFVRLAVPIDRLDGLSTGLYLAFGWVGVIALYPLLKSVGLPLLLLLLAGGLVYSIGAIVHVIERLRYRRAIWHGFVLAAAAVHYSAVVVLVAGQ